MGKEPGDHYCFYLTPEEGYGVRDDRNILDLNKEMFMQNGVLHEMVKVGAQLVMQTQHGPMAAVVRGIGDDTVKMDFNHDLAGVHLCFSGEILDVRETTDDDFSDSCGDCGGECEGCSGCH